MAKNLLKYDAQQIAMANSEWKILLNFYSDNVPVERIKYPETYYEIDLKESVRNKSILILKSRNKKNQIKNYLIRGLKKGIFLKLPDKHSKQQSVKLYENDLILCFFDFIFSLNLKSAKINWQIKSEEGYFSFYELENDILLPEDYNLQRIDKFGNMVWNFSVQELLLNPGGDEVQFDNNRLKLVDINLKEYLVDYNGKRLTN